MKKPFDSHGWVLKALKTIYSDGIVPVANEIDLLNKTQIRAARKSLKGIPTKSFTVKVWLDSYMEDRLEKPMNRGYTLVELMFVVAIITVLLAIGCVLVPSCRQYAAKNLGGTDTMTLPAGQKLELVTWKEDSLWYTTRPMRSGEVAETHTFQERSTMGALQGKVVIKETGTGPKAEKP